MLIHNRSRWALAAVAALPFAIASTYTSASSHREAPFIAQHPKVDGTDFYMFRSYEPGREGYVTFVANYLPLQDSYGGPNYFTLDPTNSPSRSGATAAVCSIKTWVCSSLTVIVGRKTRGGADWDVGATSTVDSIRSSDCTMTAYRLPCRSLPRPPPGIRSLWMSPRTKLIHLREHLAALSTVGFVVHKCQ